MTQMSEMPAKVVLLGLAENVVADLKRLIADSQHVVHSYPLLSVPGCLELIDELGAELVFCPANPEFYRPLLETFKQKKPGLPLVVVGLSAEVSEWLDTLEAGATDYCSPPFERTYINWMLEGILKPHPPVAA